MNRSVQNPILPGFHPDPSICRVGDDYYIATSTFEWYPGVLVYHSTDLANWRLVARPLDRAALLDMRGVPDSCGVWAPCLTYADGLFWLAYTNTRRFDGNFKDTPNFLTSAPSMDGPWSDPVTLNTSGFDPSLFHDTDGRKWFLNMVWDHRGDRTFFAGIDCIEYDAQQQTLLGEPRRIFEGSTLGYTEGPHLYRFGDYYYLVTAEGGTGYGHAVTIARSRDLMGPYEVDPAGPLVTARDDTDWPLQRAGHGDIVETADGEFYLVHLCSRPLSSLRRSPLGRETAIQRLTMTDDGWLRMHNGDARPAIETDLPDLPAAPVAEASDTIRFDSGELDPVFQWLRTPDRDSIFSLSERPGYLRLIGRESPGSLFTQALVARRQQHHRFEAETELEFEPRNFQQFAGLMYYYNSAKFHYLYASCDPERGHFLAIMSCLADHTLALTYPLGDQVAAIEPGRKIQLRVSVVACSMKFFWRYAGGQWQEIGSALDACHLSDEAGKGEGAQFTGAFVGMACHDVSGEGHPADFAYFRYSPDV